jgi:hypothetical protein
MKQQFYDRIKSEQQLGEDWINKYPAVNQVKLKQSIKLLTDMLAVVLGACAANTQQPRIELTAMTDARMNMEKLQVIWKKRQEDYNATTADFIQRFMLSHVTRYQTNVRRIFEADISFYQEQFCDLSAEESNVLSQAMREILLAHTQDLLLKLDRLEIKERAKTDPLAQQFKRLMGEVRKVRWADEVNKGDTGRDGPAKL